MKTINFGIIGCGRISDKFCTALVKVESTKLYAVASRSYERSNAFKNKFNAYVAYDNYQQIYDDPNIDVIYIGTINSLHKEQVINCLNSGKNVICEKPMTLNNKDTYELYKLAKEKNLFIMEAMWMKFHPAFNFVKESLDLNSIGKLKHCTIDFSIKSASDNHRLFKNEFGGGALVDVGIYPIAFALSMFGKPNKIEAKATFNDDGCDLFTVIKFFYNDFKILISTAINMEGTKQAIIEGEDGTILMDNFWMCENVKLINDTIVHDNVDFPFVTNGYEYEIYEVVKCLNNDLKESKVHTANDSMLLANVIEEIKHIIGLTYK